jgi:hypothetical protein
MFSVTTSTFDQLYRFGLSVREKHIAAATFVDREYDNFYCPEPDRTYRRGLGRGERVGRRRRADIL